MQNAPIGVVLQNSITNNEAPPLELFSKQLADMVMACITLTRRLTIHQFEYLSEKKNIFKKLEKIMLNKNGVLCRQWNWADLLLSFKLKPIILQKQHNYAFEQCLKPSLLFAHKVTADYFIRVFTAL